MRTILAGAALGLASLVGACATPPKDGMERTLKELSYLEPSGQKPVPAETAKVEPVKHPEPYVSKPQAEKTVPGVVKITFGRARPTLPALEPAPQTWKDYVSVIDIERRIGATDADAAKLEALVTQSVARIKEKDKLTPSVAFLTSVAEVLKEQGYAPAGKGVHVRNLYDALRTKTLDCDTSAFIYDAVAARVGAPFHLVLYPNHVSGRWDADGRHDIFNIASPENAGDVNWECPAGFSRKAVCQETDRYIENGRECDIDPVKADRDTAYFKSLTRAQTRALVEYRVTVAEINDESVPQTDERMRQSLLRTHQVESVLSRWEAVHGTLSELYQQMGYPDKAATHERRMHELNAQKK